MKKNDDDFEKEIVCINCYMFLTLLDLLSIVPDKIYISNCIQNEINVLDLKLFLDDEFIESSKIENLDNCLEFISKEIRTIKETYMKHGKSLSNRFLMRFIPLTAEFNCIENY